VQDNPNINIDAVKTTAASKPMMINRILLALEKELLILPKDKIVIEEFLSFRQSDGKLQAISGKHDDIIMSLAFALTVINNPI
jgi:hypothetical protein